MPTLEVVTTELNSSGLRIDRAYPGTAERIEELRGEVGELIVSLFLGPKADQAVIERMGELGVSILDPAQPKKPKSGLLIVYRGVNNRRCAEGLLQPVSERGLRKLRVLDTPGRALPNPLHRPLSGVRPNY